MNHPHSNRSPFEQLSNILGSYCRKLSGITRGHREVILDSDGTILTWNNLFKNRIGYTENEAIGKNIALLFPQIAEKMENTKRSLVLEDSGSNSLLRDHPQSCGLKITAIEKDGELLGYTALLTGLN